MTYNELLQCGLINNCVQNILSKINKFYNIRTKIIDKINLKKKISDSLLESYKESYKNLSKELFNKKTANCLLENCKKKIPNIPKNLEKYLSYIHSIKEKTNKYPKNNINNSYLKVLSITINIVKDLQKKYVKYYS